MTLAEYRSSKDPNLYWRLSEGDRQNLLEEAIEEIDRQKAKLMELVEEIKTEAKACRVEAKKHIHHGISYTHFATRANALEWVLLLFELEAVLKEE